MDARGEGAGGPEGPTAQISRVVGASAFFCASGHLLPPFRISFFDDGNGPSPFSSGRCIGTTRVERKEDEREKEGARVRIDAGVAGRIVWQGKRGARKKTC